MSESSGHELLRRTVCLQLEGMDDVVVWRDLPYGPVGDEGRAFDLYRSPDANAPLPVVIVTAGYAGAYRKVGWATSMCRLLAVSGMAAVAYSCREPAEDVRLVFSHLSEQASQLSVDTSRIGVLAASGNVPTALRTLCRDFPWTPACAAFTCGAMLDLDGASNVTTAASQFGFANPTAGMTMEDIRADVPMLLVRAGRDQFTAMNTSIDHFVRHALARNHPLTAVNYPDGVHAFELFDDSVGAKNVVRGVVRFFREHLMSQ